LLGKILAGVINFKADKPVLRGGNLADKDQRMMAGSYLMQIF
jgi:hypothetical protein